MKKIYLILSLIVWFSATKAHEVSRVYTWTPDRLVLNSDGVLKHTLHDPAVYQYDGTRLTSLSGLGVKYSNAMVTLFTNPYLNNPYAESYQVDIRFKIYYKTFSGNVDSTDHISLHIDYNPNAGKKYQAKDSYILHDAHYATLQIDSISITDGSGTALSPTSIDNLFYMNFRLITERYFQPQPTVSPSIRLIQRANNNGYLRFSWAPLRWAEYYDVEWTFVEDYDPATGLPMARSDLWYSFKNNSSRVRLKTNSYEIPMIFDRGYVLFRVRGVGQWGSEYKQEISGSWSMPESGTTIPPVRYSSGGDEIPNGVFLIDASLEHDTRKNWQYVSTFMEEGKRNDLIKYMDGTLRSRQSLTNVHSTGDILVSEKIYDHQGRPAVEILPSPYKQASDPSFSPTQYVFRSWQTPLEYKPMYNVANVGGIEAPYLRDHFDKDDPTGCDLDVHPLDNIRGSGNYYSPSNPEQNGHEAYIPDAQGYSFIQTEYTPDKTGRVRRQGQLGPQFQLGSGHEMKYYYATPAQPELDHIFGNEAGIAAHYKKIMHTDANGQSHITYKNNRGKVIATALAGLAPEQLDSIARPADQTLILNLLEEENRRETGTTAIISSRSITFSQPTTVSLDYQLVPGTYDLTTCPIVGDICYDCIYDLNIQIFDDCGTVLFDKTERIGSLDDLRGCGPITFDSDTSIFLNSGGYLVAKRLAVNEEAIDQYITDYLNLECFSDLLTIIEDSEKAKIDSSGCEAACIPCSKNTLEANYTIKQADGTEMTITVPVDQRIINDGNCVNTCGLRAGGCEAYYESLLSDMSPSGQYALYRDTTRSDIHPLGSINPNKFGLSILNEGNSLPAKNISWRTPLFDYRNPNGEIARIEISASGKPDHMADRVEIINGRRYVKPQYLSDVEDFIAFWQSSWAESLVAYHPEYHYYLWCINQKDSHEYDSAMRATDNYADAAANNLINHLALELSNDPFFTGNPGAIPMMLDSLKHYFLLDTLSSPVFNIDETTYLIINCNNINFSDSQVETCTRGNTLYSNPARADKEWKLYKELYLSTKRKVMDVIRHQEVVANGGFINIFIGWGIHSSLRDLFPFGSFGRLSILSDYADKDRRFADAQDAFTYLPSAPTNPDPPQFGNDLELFIDHAQRNQYQRCGTCPVATEFLALLNAFALEKRLTDEVILPDAPPLTLTRNLVNSFDVPNALSYSWKPKKSEKGLLIDIYANDEKNVCTIEMISESGPIKWEEIQAFISISEAGSFNKFRLRAITHDLKEVIITGFSTCLNITECDLPPVCGPTTLADDMNVFMDYLLTEGRYRESSLRIHTAGKPTTHFGNDLRARHSDFETWDWHYDGYSGNHYRGRLAITKPADGMISLVPIVENCDFWFQVEEGYSLNDIFRVVQVKIAEYEDNGDPPCEGFDYIIEAVNTKGQFFSIRAGNTCYPIANCCPDSESGGICEIPFTPLIDIPPHPCLSDALDLAKENARRIFDDTLTDITNRIRSQYIDHCLSIAEQFDLTYDESIYHYTLYYYDQAGNLTQTVPPKGVDLLDNTEISRVRTARNTATKSDDVFPSHQLKTTYQYNSINEVIRKETPDDGVTLYCYDELGRLIMSQSSEQAAAGTCSYMEYDALGRVIESGKLASVPGTFPNNISYAQFESSWLSLTRLEIFKTYYDEVLRPQISDWFDNEPLNLRNRVASITYQENSGSTYDHGTHYKYDIMGNVSDLIQENAKLARSHLTLADAGHHLKRVQYDYDLSSGNVNRVVYQPGAPDQFIHEYYYDAENRLLGIRTTTNQNEDALIRDIDAIFSYYRNGSLARETIGMERVQGLDYAYTIQGWLKGINSSTLSPYRDMGRDATATGAYGSGITAQDAFGYTLSYFNNDYRPIGALSIGSDLFAPTVTGSTLDKGSLYNGNIRYIEIGNDAFSSHKVQAHSFQYDQLDRLTEAELFRKEDIMTSNSWTGGNFTTSFGSSYRYDTNGNILSITRNDATGALMDDLTYHYADPLVNNQLASISDAISTAYTLDLEDQASNNYSYDRKSRLTSDMSEGIHDITWRNDDKVKQIFKSTDTLTFAYDALGRRVSKTTGDYTIYDVRDDAGNLLASYKISGDSIIWQYAPIYGDNRIGIYQADQLLTNIDSSRFTQIRGNKHYELSGHTGNVLSTVTDRKVPSVYGSSGIYYADISSAQDYYPFGMTMPDRSLDTLKYNFGFQGMEQDDELKGKGNSYTTEFRQYDPRVGRWLSVDPLAESFTSHSPYHSFLNNPLSNIDPKGDSSISYTNFLATMSEVDRAVSEDPRLLRLRRIQREQGELDEEANAIDRITNGPSRLRDRIEASPRITDDVIRAARSILYYEHMEQRVGPLEELVVLPITPEEYEQMYMVPRVTGITRQQMSASRLAHQAYMDERERIVSELTFLRTNIFGSATYSILRLNGLDNSEAMMHARTVGVVGDMIMAHGRPTRNVRSSSPNEWRRATTSRDAVPPAPVREMGPSVPNRAERIRRGREHSRRFRDTRRR